MGAGDKPQYGFGEDGQPLWSVCDRNAEEIRELLRRAGHRECSEVEGGFVVDGGQSAAAGEGPFLVSCTDENMVATGELIRYTVVLRGAGYKVDTDVGDAQSFQVWRG